MTWKIFTQWYHTQQFVSRRLEPRVKAEGHLGPHRPTQSHRHLGHTHCHPPQAPTTLSLLIVNRECLFEARRGSILAGTHQPWQLFNQSARVSPTFCYNSNSSNRHPSRSKGHDVYCCYCCQQYYFLAQLAMYQAADWFSQPGSSSFRFIFVPCQFMISYHLCHLVHPDRTHATSIDLPDRPFHISKAWKSVDRQTLCCMV